MTRLESVNDLKQYDKSGMIDVLDGYRSQCDQAIGLGSEFHFDLTTPIDQIIVCGMGGSAMAGELARRFARIPVFINRNYTLPEFVTPRTLLIAVSYSGNTAETLSGLAHGMDARLPMFAVSSGGKLEAIARDHNIPHLKVPAGYQPRAAMGYLALSVLAVLDRIGLLARPLEADSLIHALTAVQQKCTVTTPEAANPAKQLAQQLYRNIPVIYGTAGNTDLVAMRWKTQVNENAKQPAFWNMLPELNHNEILAFTNAELRNNLVCIFLKNDYDLDENRARIEIMTELLDGKVPTVTLAADGESELAQVLAQIYLGDYVSYYLAILNRIDPTPVELIESFKKRLAQR